MEKLGRAFGIKDVLLGCGGGGRERAFRFARTAVRCSHPREIMGDRSFAFSAHALAWQDSLFSDRRQGNTSKALLSRSIMRHPFLHVSWNGSSAVVKKLYHRFDRSSTTTTTTTLYFFSLPIYALPSISKRKKPADRTSNFVLFLALRKIAISLNSVFLYRINEIISFFFTYLSEFTLAIKIILVVNSIKHV